MAKITFIAADGTENTIDALAGLSLMENAVAQGVAGIDAVCGGNAYCGTCRVHVEPAWRTAAGERNEMEEPLLEASDDDGPGARLACQIPVTAALDGLVVRTPVSQV